MTNRELLEAAAKAAGYGPVWYLQDGGTPYIGAPYKLGGPVDYKTFNPLTDDGDNMRLASAAHLIVDLSGENVAEVRYFIGNEQFSRRMVTPRAEYKRAVVRAAAAIGASK